jgi:glutathione S-transferase
MTVRLYDSNIPSGNAYKVHLLLHNLGVAYETTDLDILATPSETRRPEFLQKNSNGRIPLLELDDGRFLPESNAILFYLAEGTKFLPEDKYGRAEVLQWMFFEQYSHEPYVAVMKFWKYWGGLDRCNPKDIERWKTRGQAALDVLAARLERNDFLVEGRYTIADIALYAYTQSAEAVGYTVAPSVKAWLARVSGQPGYVRIKVDPTGKCPL